MTAVAAAPRFLAPVTPPALSGAGPAATVARGVTCERCPRARCLCTEPLCRCSAHSHYRRCADCARGVHVPASVAVRALVAFGLWRWPATRLDHLTRRPER